MNVEHYGLILAPRLKTIYHQIWVANSQTLGLMFQHLLYPNINALAFISK
jgi:hypothetical protein